MTIVAWISFFCVIGWFIEAFCDLTRRVGHLLTKDAKIEADVNVVMQAGHPDIEAPESKRRAERPAERYLAQHSFLEHRRRQR